MRKLTRGQKVGLVTAMGAVAAFAVFFHGVTAREHTEAPQSSAAPQAAADPAATREHEFKMLTQQLAKKPDHAPVLFRLAQIARESGRLQEAADYFRKATAAEPDNVDARLELGRTLYELGDQKGGLAETLKILEQKPGHVDALYNAGAIYANSGDLEKAKQYWREAVRAGAATESGTKARNALQQIGAS